MNRFKIAAATAGVAAVSTLLPLGIAGPAHATTESFNCSFTPYAPTPVRNGELGVHGRRMAKYKVDVTCDVGDRDVVLDQDFWEQDLREREGAAYEDDDFFGSEITNLTFTVPGTQSVTHKRELPDTGPIEDGIEEVYQAVQFQVSSGGVDGGWTAYELTQPTPLER